MENKKVLVASGCSFTFEPWCWPTFVANELEYDLINVGMGCQGNGLITKKLMYTVINLLKTKSPDDIIVGIMWSGIDRFDFHKKNVKLTNNLDGWVENPTSVVPGYKNWIIGNYHWQHEYNKLWYENFYSDIEMAIKTIENILLVQLFLEKNKIKYFMTTYMDIFNSEYSKNITNDIEVKYLYDNINFSTFLPIVGCHEWVKEHYGNNGGFNTPNKDGYTGIHPTEFGHKMFANEVIIPFLKNKL